MALSYGKKCNLFAGRRRLVAQPGGLNVVSACLYTTIRRECWWTCWCPGCACPRRSRWASRRRRWQQCRPSPAPSARTSWPATPATGCASAWSGSAPGRGARCAECASRASSRGSPAQRDPPTRHVHVMLITRQRSLPPIHCGPKNPDPCEILKLLQQVLSNINFLYRESTKSLQCSHL